MSDRIIRMVERTDISWQASSQVRRSQETECGGTARKGVGTAISTPGKDTRELVSLLLVIREMKGEIWHDASPTKERTRANRGGMREKREERAGRILRSACKPISISSEIRLSEFLLLLASACVAYRPRGPQLVYWPLACPDATQDSSQYPVHIIPRTNSLVSRLAVLEATRLSHNISLVYVHFLYSFLGFVEKFYIVCVCLFLSRMISWWFNPVFDNHRKMDDDRV